MKFFFNVIRVGLKVLRCVACQHKNNCPHSVFIVYKNIEYELQIVNKKEVDINGNCERTT